MILPLKIALGAILALLLALGGTLWYSNLVAAERDQALGKLGALELAVELANKRAAEKEAASLRLAAVLKERSAREAEVLQISRALQEKINALPNRCTFSSAASRVLWEVYESAVRVPPAGPD